MDKTETKDVTRIMCEECKLNDAIHYADNTYSCCSCFTKKYGNLRSELQKAKELNGELVKIKNLVEELIEVAHFRNQWPTTTEAFESLIKKSNP